MRNKFNVLVVDDAFFMRVLLKKTLAQKPKTEYTFEVIAEAINGKEGLDLYKICNSEIVTVDINMDKVNGIEFLNKVKKINPNVYAIIISTTMNADVKKLLSDPNTYYLPKSFQSEFLYKILDEIALKLNSSLENKTVEKPVIKKEQVKENITNSKENVTVSEKTVDNKKVSLPPKNVVKETLKKEAELTIPLSFMTNQTIPKEKEIKEDIVLPKVDINNEDETETIICIPPKVEVIKTPLVEINDCIPEEEIIEEEVIEVEQENKNELEEPKSVELEDLLSSIQFIVDLNAVSDKAVNDTSVCEETATIDIEESNDVNESEEIILLIDDEDDQKIITNEVENEDIDIALEEEVVEDSIAENNEDDEIIVEEEDVTENYHNESIEDTKAIELEDSIVNEIPMESIGNHEETGDELSAKDKLLLTTKYSYDIEVSNKIKDISSKSFDIVPPKVIDNSEASKNLGQITIPPLVPTEKKELSKLDIALNKLKEIDLENIDLLYEDKNSSNSNEINVENHTEVDDLDLQLSKLNIDIPVIDIDSANNTGDSTSNMELNEGQLDYNASIKKRNGVNIAPPKRELLEIYNPDISLIKNNEQKTKENSKPVKKGNSFFSKLFNRKK